MSHQNGQARVGPLEIGHGGKVGQGHGAGLECELLFPRAIAWMIEDPQRTTEEWIRAQAGGQHRGGARSCEGQDARLGFGVLL